MILSDMILSAPQSFPSMGNRKSKIANPPQALLDAGYDATGIDATREMLGEAKANYPTLSTRLTCDTLPNLSRVADTSYDRILCWAVLMHSLKRETSTGKRWQPVSVSCLARTP
jgi:hypothetical protein